MEDDFSFDGLFPAGSLALGDFAESGLTGGAPVAQQSALANIPLEFPDFDQSGGVSEPPADDLAPTEEGALPGSPDPAPNLETAQEATPVLDDARFEQLPDFPPAKEEKPPRVRQRAPENAPDTATGFEIGTEIEADQLQGFEIGQEIEADQLGGGFQIQENFEVGQELDLSDLGDQEPVDLADAAQARLDTDEDIDMDDLLALRARKENKSFLQKGADFKDGLNRGVDHVHAQLVGLGDAAVEASHLDTAVLKIHEFFTGGEVLKDRFGNPLKDTDGNEITAADRAIENTNKDRKDFATVSLSGAEAGMTWITELGIMGHSTIAGIEKYIAKNGIDDPMLQDLVVLQTINDLQAFKRQTRTGHDESFTGNAAMLAATSDIGRLVAGDSVANSEKIALDLNKTINEEIDTELMQDMTLIPDMVFGLGLGRAVPLVTGLTGSAKAVVARALPTATARNLVSGAAKRVGAKIPDGVKKVATANSGAVAAKATLMTAGATKRVAQVLDNVTSKVTAPILGGLSATSGVATAIAAGAGAPAIIATGAPIAIGFLGWATKNILAKGGSLAKPLSTQVAQALRTKVQYGMYGPANAKVFERMAANASNPAWVRKAAGEAAYFGRTRLGSGAQGAVLGGTVESVQEAAQAAIDPTARPGAAGEGAAAGGLIGGGFGGVGGLTRSMDKHFGDVDAIAYREKLKSEGGAVERFDRLPPKVRRGIAAAQATLIDSMDIKLLDAKEFDSFSKLEGAHKLASGVYMHGDGIALNMSKMDPDKILETLSHEVGHAAYHRLPDGVKAQWRKIIEEAYAKQDPFGQRPDPIEQFRRDYADALGVDPKEITHTRALDELFAEHFLGHAGTGTSLMRNKADLSRLGPNSKRQLSGIRQKVRQNTGVHGVMKETPFVDSKEVEDFIGNALRDLGSPSAAGAGPRRKKGTKRKRKPTPNVDFEITIEDLEHAVETGSTIRTEDDTLYVPVSADPDGAEVIDIDKLTEEMVKRDIEMDPGNGVMVAVEAAREGKFPSKEYEEAVEASKTRLTNKDLTNAVSPQREQQRSGRPDPKSRFAPRVDQAAMVSSNTPTPESLPEGFTALAPEDRHITIFSRGSLTDEQKAALASVADQMPQTPSPRFGKTFEVKRPEKDKHSLVYDIENQAEFAEFAQAWADLAGIQNPEPDRYFHASIANTGGGSPFKSVGDVTVDDLTAGQSQTTVQDERGRSDAVPTAGSIDGAEGGGVRGPGELPGSPAALEAADSPRVPSTATPAAGSDTAPIRYPDTSEPPLVGLPATVKVDGETTTFGPFQVARDAAREYTEQAGLPYDPPKTYAKVKRSRAQSVAAEFESMEHNPQDPAVQESYQAMIAETLSQYDVLKQTGLVVEPIPPGQPDPYGNPRNVIRDVVENGHMWFFPTNDGFGGAGSADVDISNNPLLEPTGEVINGHHMVANDVFRVVHDYFGHIKEGVGFRAGGEENAWRSHMSMYSDKAKPAMTTETRGQNSWVNYGKFAEQNQTANGAETEYAPQKIGLLPDWVTTEGAKDPAPDPGTIDPNASFKPLDDRTGFRDDLAPGALPTTEPGSTAPDPSPTIVFDDAFKKVTRKRNKGKSNASHMVAAIKAPWLDSDKKKRRGYPGITPEARKGTQKKVLEATVEEMKDNLLTLFDHPSVAPWRDRAKEWYVGARKIAEEFGERFGVSEEQAAAVYASLSPQKDWFQNVSLGDRVGEFMTQVDHSEPLTEDQINTAVARTKAISDSQMSKANKAKTLRILESLRGVAFEEIRNQPDNPVKKESNKFREAAFLRVWDESVNDTSYDRITPEGGRLAPTGAKVSWGSGHEIANAISAMRATNGAELQSSIGKAHKVKNFFNNILNPLSELFATVDTHAVAAAFLSPFGGSSAMVTDNFSGREGIPVQTNGDTGLIGTYAMHFEAIRRAAEARGILPREMQSVTWEAIRGLFSAEDRRSAMHGSVLDLWDQVNSGNLTKADAIEQIIEAAGGIDAPPWVE